MDYRIQSILAMQAIERVMITLPNATSSVTAAEKDAIMSKIQLLLKEAGKIPVKR